MITDKSLKKTNRIIDTDNKGPIDNNHSTTDQEQNNNAKTMLGSHVKSPSPISLSGGRCLICHLCLFAYNGVLVRLTV